MQLAGEVAAILLAAFAVYLLVGAVAWLVSATPPLGFVLPDWLAGFSRVCTAAVEYW